MNLNYLQKNKKHSKNNRRFLTLIDMAIVKQDTARHNALIKRGIISKKGTYYIHPCGCGSAGCFLHIEK